MMAIVGCGSASQTEANDADLIPNDSSIQNADIYETPPERTFAPISIQSTIPFDIAAQYFAELEVLFAADGGELWGVNLSVPFIFVDSVTRDIVANRPDPLGILMPQGYVYAGVLPPEVSASYGIHYFAVESWAMIPWYLMEFFADDIHARLRINSHLAFHRTQRDIFSEDFWWGNAHMDDPTARTKVILETNALATALESTGEVRLSAIADALSIRAERRIMFPDNAEAENIYEIHEGLAQYTELRLNYHSLNEMLPEFRNAAYRMKILPSVSWHFAYWTGSAYAFLLDEFYPTWKENVSITSDLGHMLQYVLRITELAAFNEIDLYKTATPELSHTIRLNRAVIYTC